MDSLAFTLSIVKGCIVNVLLSTLKLSPENKYYPSSINAIDPGVWPDTFIHSIE